MSSSLVKVTEISEFVKEDSLKKLFSFIGDLRHVSLKRSKSSSTFEAVIDFIQPEDAKLALHLDGLYLLDRNLHLELYKDEDQLNRIARTLRVDHVPFQHTLDGLKTVFEAVEGVRRMRLGNGTDKDTHLGYAYVEFVSSEHAQLAMRKLDQVEFQGQKLRYDVYIVYSFLFTLLKKKIFLILKKKIIFHYFLPISYL
ncbi:hypothetical protein HMI55_005190 [Coelomomyces lativittatus]|nr:hypothetical protein HMI55_005190 [Coelomomyces lativittatus]